MGQLALFDSSARVLTDGPHARVTYTPRFVDPATAAGWFAELHSAVNRRHERRQMDDREVDVPRLVGHYRLEPPMTAVPAAIVDAAAAFTLALAVVPAEIGRRIAGGTRVFPWWASLWAPLWVCERACAAGWLWRRALPLGACRTAAASSGWQRIRCGTLQRRAT